MRWTSRVGWGLAVLGWLVGCGTKPAVSESSVPRREGTAEAPSEPVTPTDPGGPVEASPVPDPAPVEPSPEVSPNRLCGPAPRPCTLELDEPFAFSSPSSLYSYPANPTLFLDGEQRPHVFGAGEGSLFGGTLAERSSTGVWSLQHMPREWGGAAFTLLPNGRRLAMMSQDWEASAPSTVWEWEAGDWRPRADLGQRLLSQTGMPAFQTDAGGKVHALFGTFEAYPRLVYVSEADGWTPRFPGGGGRMMFMPGFTVSPRSGAHFSYWEQVNDQWLLTWQSTSSSPERILSLTCCGADLLNTSRQRLMMARTSDGSPEGPETSHLFFMRPQEGVPGLHEIAYASRTGEGAWTVRTLLREELLKPRCSDTPPKGDNDSCDEEFVTAGLNTLVATEQEVRLFIERMHLRVTLEAACRRENSCQWEVKDRWSDYRVELAWVDGDQFHTQLLAQGPDPIHAMSAQADAQGRIHLVEHIERGWFDPQVEPWHYLILGPPSSPP